MPAETYAQENYSTEAYVADRPRYPQALTDIITSFNKEGHEGHALAVDLGCGPGIFTGTLVPHFDKVIGVDPSEKMIRTAKKTVPGALFMTGSADSLPFIGTGTVDAVTAATAAHYFPSGWYTEVERILKPGGSLAVLTYAAPCLGPLTPNVEKAQTLARDFVASIPDQYVDAASLARDLYRDFPLPSISSNLRLVERKVWNQNGRVDDTEAGGRGRLMMSSLSTVAGLRAFWMTGSPVHQWYEAQPELSGDAGPVAKFINDLKAITGLSEDSPLQIGYPLTLLLFRRATNV